MDDKLIIELLFRRSETALDELTRKYSRLYKSIIREVLSDECDVDECGNDVLLALWNSIPPNRPESLPAYICKIARRIGIDRLRYHTRQKRNSGFMLTLSELEECLPAEESIQETEERNEQIRTLLTAFLRSLDPETEILFVRRYIYLESVAELAKRFQLEENRISVKLYRARKKKRCIYPRHNFSVFTKMFS